MVLLLVACSSAPAPTPSSKGDGSLHRTKARLLRAGGAPASTHAVAGWKKLYPDRTLYVCGAAGFMEEGVYWAGTNLVVVRGRSTFLFGTDEGGSSDVLSNGAVIGNLRWMDNGRCKWAGQGVVVVSGRVKGGGDHRVAGCPPGEVIQTAPDGTFETHHRAGRRCGARVVVGREGLARGPMVEAVAGQELVLEPATPLSPGQIKTMVADLLKTTAPREQRLVEQLAHLNGADGEEADWLVDRLSKQHRALVAWRTQASDPKEQVLAVEAMLYAGSLAEHSAR